jgi:dethiobiotin synthetase
MSTVFVTAIGTDCGKTHVSAAILRELIARGRPALALKPLMSGYSPDALQDSDAGRLLNAMGSAVSKEAVDGICWKSFTDWLAPNAAARRAGVALDYAELFAFVRDRLHGHDGAALVEGAGGVMSPLTDTHTNIDLAADLRSPVLLLASNYLGAVSHTLTALEVLARRNLEVKAVVVTETLPNAGPSAPFLEELARWTSLPLLAAPFARMPADDRGYAAELVQRLFH